MPARAVWRFLEDSGLLAATDPSDPTAKLLPWDQVYHFIAPHEKVIRTLLAPATSMDAYYRELATAALMSGLGDPDFLLALLWHAPHGDARTSPERLAHLETLIAEASRQHRMGQGNLSPATYKDSGDDPVRKARGRPAAAPASEAVTEIMDFMENRVILDRKRYEAMVFEM